MNEASPPKTLWVELPQAERVAATSLAETQWRFWNVSSDAVLVDERAIRASEVIVNGAISIASRGHLISSNQEAFRLCFRTGQFHPDGQTAINKEIERVRFDGPPAVRLLWQTLEYEDDTLRRYGALNVISPSGLLASH